MTAESRFGRKIAGCSRAAQTKKSRLAVSLRITLARKFKLRRDIIGRRIALEILSERGHLGIAFLRGTGS
jgi:hypothetical protein